MNELTVIVFIVAIIAVAYLWVYPRFAGKDLRRMAWLDVALTLIPLGVAALLFGGTNPDFRLLIFDTNWFVFTLVTYVILEVPLFLLYLKARGLSDQYAQLWRAGFTSSASVERVHKSLDDTTWDGLRTARGKKILVLLSVFLPITGGAILVVADPQAPVTVVLLGFVLLILAALWYLLRQAVRFIPDAPDDALDERTIAERNRSFLPAYRVLSTAVIVVAGFAIGYTVADQAPGSRENPHQFSFTWTQMQAVFWVILFYVSALPAMVLAWKDTQKEEKIHV